MSMLRWSWLDDVRSRERDLGGMLASSTADDGILGYAREPTERQSRGFVDGLAWLVDQGAGHVLIGDTAQEAVAMCVMKTDSMPNCRHIAEVSKAYLSPTVRGTTAVYQLVDAVCTRAGELGVELLTIDVREGSKAHRIWSALGFTSYGVLSDYARVGGQAHRGHFMYHRTAELSAIASARLRARGVGAAAG